MASNIGNISGAFRLPPPPQLGGAGSFGGGQQGGVQGGQFGQGGVGFSGQSSFQPPSPQQAKAAHLPPPELLADLGQALRIPPEQLAQKLMSGQSLSQVASGVGLNQSQLQSKIEGFLSQRLPNLSDGQRSDMASHIIAGAPPRPPPLPGMNAQQQQ
jgi:hypothetical protein